MPNHEFVTDTFSAWLRGDPVDAANEAEAVLAVFDGWGSEARLQDMMTDPATPKRVAGILLGIRAVPVADRAELFRLFHT